MIDNNFITSWDDGHKLDIKLFNLLKKYEIPAIFFICSSHYRLNKKELLSEKELQDISCVYELGGHTRSHPKDLKKLSKEEQKDEIMTNRSYLRGISRHHINKFCYPSGRYNEETVSILRNSAFEQARTTLVGYTDKPEDPYRIKTSAHVYPNREEYRGIHWLEFAKSKWDEAVKKGKNGYFHLWGHSWEVEKFDEWDNLEKFFKYIQKDKGWW